ncbi:hypothetical protein F5Y17DRAFT_460420 [Xylariaceae sp. FL0594]|nr:hypothetical protein F5Y17DRAFT_460420 [Xylariaceae sp. FL0594]
MESTTMATTTLTVPSPLLTFTSATTVPGTASTSSTTTMTTDASTSGMTFVVHEEKLDHSNQRFNRGLCYFTPVFINIQDHNVYYVNYLNKLIVHCTLQYLYQRGGEPNHFEFLMPTGSVPPSTTTSSATASTDYTGASSSTSSGFGHVQLALFVYRFNNRGLSYSSDHDYDQLIDSLYSTFCHCYPLHLISGHNKDDDDNNSPYPTSTFTQSTFITIATTYSGSVIGIAASVPAGTDVRTVPESTSIATTVSRGGYSKLSLSSCATDGFGPSSNCPFTADTGIS